MFCQFVHKTKLIRRLFILNVQCLQSKPNPLISILTQVVLKTKKCAHPEKI